MSFPASGHSLLLVGNKVPHQNHAVLCDAEGQISADSRNFFTEGGINSFDDSVKELIATTQKGK